MYWINSFDGRNDDDDNASSNTTTKKKKVGAELQVSVMSSFAPPFPVREPFPRFIFIACTRASDQRTKPPRMKTFLCWELRRAAEESRRRQSPICISFRLYIHFFRFINHNSHRISCKEGHCSWVFALRNVKYPPTKSLGSFLMILNSAMLA